MSQVEQLNEEQLAEREKVAVALHELLAIPANQLNITITIVQTILNALMVQRQDQERRYRRPVVIRTYYPGSIRATVGDQLPDGVLDVKLEVMVDDNNPELGWKTYDVDEVAIMAFKRMVLSQTATPGDVYFITNNATIEANMEKAADFFEQSMRLQEKNIVGELQEEAQEMAADTVAESATH